MYLYSTPLQKKDKTDEDSSHRSSKDDSKLHHKHASNSSHTSSSIISHSSSGVSHKHAHGLHSGSNSPLYTASLSSADDKDRGAAAVEGDNGVDRV